MGFPTIPADVKSWSQYTHAVTNNANQQSFCTRRAKIFSTENDFEQYQLRTYRRNFFLANTSISKSCPSTRAWHRRRRPRDRRRWQHKTVSDGTSPRRYCTESAGGYIYIYIYRRSGRGFASVGGSRPAGGSIFGDVRFSLVSDELRVYNMDLLAGLLLPVSS